MQFDSTDFSLQTRSSLIHRVRDWEDHESWDEFYRLYRRVLHQLALRAGLPSHEADEIVQEVFGHVAQHIAEFQAPGQRGAFRRWLLNQARWRILDRRRHTHRRIEGRGLIAEQHAHDFTAHTATLERLPDEGTAEAHWESEWRHSLLDTALKRLAQRSAARHFQIFDLYVRQGWTARRVSRELGVNMATVYVIGHRLTKQLRLEVERLRQALG